MQVLITGGAGFIGSHLTEKLMEGGNDVIVIDDLSSGRYENIEHLEGNEGFEFRNHDVLEPITVDTDLDSIFHLASRASPEDYQEHPVHTLRTNVEGTQNMLELAHDHGAKLLFSSTSEVYGDPEVHPQPESYNGNVNPVGPRACYNEGKRAGEALITSFANNHNINYRIVRIFNTYGSRMRPDDGRVISNFVTQALNDDPITVYGDGSQTRSFCYVDDMVEGLIAAIGSESGSILNLGNPDEITILELAECIREVVDTDSEIVHEELPEDDPERRKPDISRATNELDWLPSIGLQEGLTETARYFKNLD